MENHLYRDIKERTGGEIYIGVVGPVRTGQRMNCLSRQQAKPL